MNPATRKARTAKTPAASVIRLARPWPDVGRPRLPVALALLRRHRTGRGCFIDLAQREGAATLAGEAFAAASLFGQSDPPHTGNRSSRWAPQGAYRCEGSEQWIGGSGDRGIGNSKPFAADPTDEC